MLAPELKDHVPKVVERDAHVVKQVREAREMRRNFTNSKKKDGK